MALKVVKLRDFLENSNIGSVDVPGFLHTTQASNIYKIAEEQRIVAVPCDVFTNDNLSYFFVGRPAYKWSVKGEANYWQCPIVFVLENLGEAKAERIFPFDSGAFHNRRFPEYITTFPLENFDVGSEFSLISKIVSAFYGDKEQYKIARSYTPEKIKSQFELTPRHQEIEALVQLFEERSSGSHDDRRSAIEVQVKGDVCLSSNLVGIVYPDVYDVDAELMDVFRSLGCEMEPYGLYPVAVDAYFSQIYQLVMKIQRKKGL
jgi:hypothetical protein